MRVSACWQTKWTCLTKGQKNKPKGFGHRSRRRHRPRIFLIQSAANTKMRLKGECESHSHINHNSDNSAQGQFLLLATHCTAIEERAPSHKEHDANGSADAAEHHSRDCTGKAIHSLILSCEFDGRWVCHYPDRSACCRFANQRVRWVLTYFDIILEHYKHPTWPANKFQSRWGIKLRWSPARRRKRRWCSRSHSAAAPAALRVSGWMRLVGKLPNYGWMSMVNSYITQQ